MAAGRYVVVDPSTMLVVGGPYLWDGATDWAAPEIEVNPNAGYELMTEAAAIDAGYNYPPEPDPA